ncbi:Uncharacterised protein [Escherichia coli]|nr:Uncharacterised protein [Escherichia coli]
MLVHSILCMFTPLPSVSQHALASSTYKGRGFLLCSGCSLNHFGDFLLQRAARLHSLSTGENGLPGSFDVCWRENKSLRCAIEGSRIELCAVEGSLVSNMCAGGKDRELHVRWREKLMDRCVLEGKSGQTAGRPLQRTSKTGNWTSLPGSTHFLNAAALQHTLIRGVSALDCENGRLQNFPGLSSQLNSRDSRLF